jgi:hypothetical protein
MMYGAPDVRLLHGRVCSCFRPDWVRGGRRVPESADAMWKWVRSFCSIISLLFLSAMSMNSCTWSGEIFTLRDPKRVAC